MSKKNDSKKCKIGYNPNRGSYLTSDGRYYCYERWDDEAKFTVTQRFEGGKDMSLELTIMFDEFDHKMNLNDRYEDELKDPQLEASLRRHDEASHDEYDILMSEAFNRSEDELDIDFDINEKFSAILEKFTNETWKSLNESEKTDAISDFVCTLGECLGLEDIPDTIVFDDLDDAYGFYNPLNNSICLNKQYFNDSSELVNTIAHEVRHAYQEYRAGLLETREDELYRVNLDNYISPVQLPDGGWLFFTDYQDQYVEVDARAFANLFTEAMKNE